MEVCDEMCSPGLYLKIRLSNQRMIKVGSFFTYKGNRFIMECKKVLRDVFSSKFKTEKWIVLNWQDSTCDS